MDMHKIHVDKVEAARRQMDTAVRLLFANEDPLPIHTLVMAAFGILKDLSSGRPDLFWPQVLEAIVRPEKRQALWRTLNASSNYLKHADKDPSAILSDFREESNDSMLVLGALYYQGLGYPLTTEMQAIITWYLATRPDVLSEQTPPALRDAISCMGQSLQALTRQEQLACGQVLIQWAKDHPHVMTVEPARVTRDPQQGRSP